MTLLCRANDVRVGLVTDGERWTVVNAPVGATSGYATWLARLWWQEPVTFRAFVSLLGVRRCFGAEDQRLDRLLEKSIAFQEEVTDTLGEQVRRAVEVLIQALGRADQDRNGELLEDVGPAELYEAGLTVMMRLVFLLCAEERGLLLLGDPVYDQCYAISTLRAALREEESLHGPEVLERRYDAWSRMLAVFRAVYGGIEHETLRLPALGGSLFDPDRFPFLEGRPKGTSWRDTPADPLPIDNRTVLLLLTALQVLEHRGGAQLLSYRALDVEQIGHVYEGLLEYTAVKVPDVTVGLIGSKKVAHPVIGLAELEFLHSRGLEASVERLTELTGRSASAIRNALQRGGDGAAFLALVQACGGDEALARRLLPFASLIRPDSWGHPLVYRAGSFAVARGADRRETGTHYTPRSLTETIVDKTLEPIVYEGPAEGRPREQWRLKPSAELLDLKICDPAMGSGAFLVQACRYLSERLVESWGREEDAGRCVTVDGEVVDAAGSHELLPKDVDERLLIARRLVAEQCLYGVDLNPLAVELAKLSIWLVTMAKGRPFAFLDHNLRCGDSLLGIHRLDQLTKLTMDPDRPRQQQRLFGRNIENAVRQAIELRLRLRGIRIRDIRDVEAMAHLHEQARHILEAPSLIADAMIGEALCSGGNAGRLEAALDGLAMEADRFLSGDVDAAKAIRKRAMDGLAVESAGGTRQRRTFHWPLEFPEVFQRPNAGFHIMIGNPPWGQKGIADDNQLKVYVRNQYPSAIGIYDLFRPFVERAVRLMQTGGFFGVVLPDILLLKDYPETRRFLLEQLSLLAIDSWGMVFRSSVIDTITIIGRKVVSPPGHAIRVNVHESQRLLAHTVLQERFSNNPGFTFNLFLTDDRQLILRTLEACPRLGDYFEVHEGVHSGNIRKELFVDAAVDDTCRPLLFGRGEIAPYVLRWSGKFIRLGVLPERKTPERYANLGRPEWYEQEKILVRRTGDYVLAAVDQQRYYASNNFFLVLPRRSSSLDLDGLCALLNSKLMTWYFRTIAPRRGRVFAEIKIKHLNTFPLPPQALTVEGCRRLNELGAERRLLGAEANDHRGFDQPTARRMLTELDERINSLVLELFEIRGVVSLDNC
jgi:type I restriction-modification system DNA methylase subunit